MAIKQLNPYLIFNGTAEKAIKLYESALGARTEGPMRYGDVPPQNGHKVAPEDKNRIMHALLHIGAGVVMVGDAPPDVKAPTEGNIHVSLDFDDLKDMTKKFDALAARGKVEQPLKDAFWGATFGMLTDEFGVCWMFNCAKKS